MSSDGDVADKWLSTLYRKTAVYNRRHPLAKTVGTYVIMFRKRIVVSNERIKMYEVTVYPVTNLYVRTVKAFGVKVRYIHIYKFEIK
jgi:hypothetical protein